MWSPTGRGRVKTRETTIKWGNARRETGLMKRFIEGADRTQVSLLPGCVEDYVEAENPVRVIEAFVEQLDLRAMGFEGVDPEATGRPAYHPAVLLKIYLYGYLNRIQS